MLADSKAYFA